MRLDVIYNEDCLLGMRRLPDASIDMILCDLPYGNTSNHWDSVIPPLPLWEQYKRVTKERSAIVLTCQQPFASELIASNRRWFRCEWIWEKDRAVGFLNAKRHPLRAHENILVFASGMPCYTPQMTPGKPYRAARRKQTASYGSFNPIPTNNEGGWRYPRTVLKMNRQVGLHPTRKPVALFEYFIRTYSSPGAVVLDNCIGSGTTAIACINAGRRYIGFETDEAYCEIARERIRQHRQLREAQAA